MTPIRLIFMDLIYPLFSFTQPLFDFCRKTVTIKVYEAIKEVIGMDL